MPEYQLKFTEEDESRQRILNELLMFINTMDNRPLAVTTLNKEQSENWDEEGDIDYQDDYGRQIIEQFNDDITETLIICDFNGLPIALAALDNKKSWQAIGIDKRLRLEVAMILKIENIEFDQQISKQ